MTGVTKLSFLLAIILAFLLLYRLVEKRQRILSEYEIEKEESAKREPFAAMPLISNSKNMTLPLKEYEIMSSWNSVRNSNGDVSLDALDDVLIRGYRFVDLEIYSVDNKPNVSFSIQKAVDVMDATPVLFLDVVRRIASKGFSTNNGQDPLFLHLRIKSKNSLIFEKLADILTEECKNRLYPLVVTNKTLLSDLKGKLIIVVDRNHCPTSETYKCIGTCKNDFIALINMFSGTPEMETMEIEHKLEQPTTPLIKTSNGYTNVKKIKMVTHSMGSRNVDENGPHFYSLVKNHSVQIFPHKVYHRDRNLNVYEEFFANNGHRAFVPMSNAREDLEDKV
jgi:hypothetical protein